MLKQHASCWNLTCACISHTRVCHNHTHMCQNQTLRVEISLVLVEITVLSVVITKSQCVWKLHFCVVITLDSVCHIHTHTCQYYSCASGNHTLRVKSHSACRNRTLRAETNLLRTFVRVVIIIVSVIITLIRVKITLCV
jgi:hypothetical protein